MTSSRVISSFTATPATDTIRVTANAVSESPTLGLAADDTYFHSLSGGSADFCTKIESLLEGHSQITTATVTIIGCNQVDATKADGRLHITCDLDFSLDFSHPDWTIDKRAFGFPADHASDEPSASTVLISDQVHLGGFYPQITADWDLPRRGSWASAAGLAASNTVEIVDWGAYERVDLEWLHVLAALMREVGATDSVRAGFARLTTGDTCAALESWGRYLTLNPGETWRFYPDATDLATFIGPYRFPADSPLWADALALSEVLSRAGEHWTARIEGVRGPL